MFRISNLTSCHVFIQGWLQPIVHLHWTLSSSSFSLRPTNFLSSFTASMHFHYTLPPVLPSCTNFILLPIHSPSFLWTSSNHLSFALSSFYLQNIEHRSYVPLRSIDLVAVVEEAVAEYNYSKPLHWLNLSVYTRAKCCSLRRPTTYTNLSQTVHQINRPSQARTKERPLPQRTSWDCSATVTTATMTDAAKINSPQTTLVCWTMGVMGPERVVLK